MTDDKRHFNTQFLGDSVKLPDQNVGTTPPVNRKAPTTLVVVLLASIASIVGAYLGAYGATGLLTSTQLNQEFRLYRTVNDNHMI